MCASGNTSSTSFRIKIEATNSVKEVICYNIMGTKSCSQSGLRLSSGRSSFSSWVFKEKMIMQFKFRSRSNVLITPYKMLHEFCLPFFKTVHLKEIWVICIWGLSVQKNQEVDMVLCTSTKVWISLQVLYSKCTSGQLPNSRLQFGFAAVPTQSVAWNWATDQKCI